VLKGTRVTAHGSRGESAWTDGERRRGLGESEEEDRDQTPSMYHEHRRNYTEIEGLLARKTGGEEGGKGG